ncbi:RING finger and transmembrane domain-containing protein 2 isoform X5 [Orussus abietinus]|uniref:RING finger and transmembrane domain-containing protein 2 isoform X5 n=1 Tax=Orussus abietinus TaxID=222816 RepID=UPI0006268652|nr:RING finger and transmembrane domain-containing protein 2 isoform X5 [Orussus abietinus]
MMKSKFGKNLKLFVVRSREISKQSKNQLDNETSVLQLLLLHVIIMAGIRRFVERQQLDPRISLTSWLNMRSQNTVATTSELPESVVINIDNQFAILENDILRQNQSHYHHHHRATPIDNSVHIHNSATEGKYYLAVEAASQTCRCIAPIPSWVNYLSEPYKGFEVASGVSWSIMYIISKGGDLLPRLKLLRTAVWKLFQNVNLGVSPSVEQLEAAGGICTICHEEFSIPVRLCCKHIFCEACVSIWLDRERSCPLCRTYVTDDPSYRDGHTFFAQWY